MIKTVHDLFQPLESDADNLIGRNEDMMFDAEQSQAFVLKSNARYCDKNGIPLLLTQEQSIRKSIRTFNDVKVLFSEFSNFLGCLKNRSASYEMPRYFYPSAGGLYPIDVYVCVKENRVDNIEKGTYLYLPCQNQLKFVSPEIPPTKSHYYNNRMIDLSSAFSLYFFYNCEASMPKYGGMGLYYGMIDSGIMLELLTERAIKNNLGTCIIGDIDFEKTEYVFHLKDNMIYLHCMEVGHYEN